MNPTNFDMQNVVNLNRLYGFRLGKAVSIGLACALSTGCAYNPPMTSATMPTVKPIYIAHGSDAVDRYYTLGKYYFWQNRLVKAQEAFQQALKIQPNSVDALNGMGAVYDRFGQFEDAQRFYRQALSITPEAAYIWANLGYSLLLEGRVVMAVALLEKTVKMDPSNTMAAHHLALANEKLAKLAAISPEIRNGLPILASTAIHFPEESAAAYTKLKPSIAAEEAKPDGSSVVTVIPHESVKYSNVIQAVVPARNRSPDTVLSRQHVASTASHSEINAVRATMASVAKPDVSHHESYVSSVSREVVTPAFGRIRVEISNGNGVTGMAKALKIAMKPDGVNVTRLTNALPFNKPHTVIICANEMQQVAKALARLLPGNPSITIASVVNRNVEIRVVLGEDAVMAWSNSKESKVAALDK